MSKRPKLTNRTAVHRPSLKVRRFRHDMLIAVDLFSGFGGLTQGIEVAGFDVIMAANHNDYKVEIHEANHPNAEHWIADLVDPESSDYHSAADLPAADLLVAGVSCVNHSLANTKRAYEQTVGLWELEDPDYEARVTRSERDRATATCVLQYAAKHHPRMILVECTTQLYSWGPLVPGSKKIGDGTTYRWWLKQFANLDYDHKVLYLNSMFFGPGQSRDRAYWVFWDKKIPAPDLEHRPLTWCHRCEDVVEAKQTWKTGVPPSGTVCYGKQYNYRCPSCYSEVVPPFTPSLDAIDLSDLGTKIGDRKRPLAPATMARAERCRQRFAEFPAVLMPDLAVTGQVLAAHRHNGDGKHITEPMDTVTTTHEKAVLLSTAAIMAAAGNTYEHPGSDCRSRDLSQPLPAQTATNSQGLLTPPIAMAVDNYQGAPRGVDEPLPTQVGSETLGILSARVLPNRTNGVSRSLDEPMQTLVGNAGSGGLAVLSTGVVPFRRNTVPTTHGEAMPTVTADQIPGLLTAAGTIKNNGNEAEAKYRAHPLSDPLGAITSEPAQSLLFSGWFKNNGSTGTETAAHPVTDPLGTLTSRDTTGLLAAEWAEALADIKLEDCYFRMMREHEVGRGCGFDVDFGDHKGTFIVWGSPSEQVDGYGNAVTPQVGTWIGTRLRAALHGVGVAA